MIDWAGWTWEYIDEEMTLPRLDAINQQWQRNPPMSVTLRCIAQALGMKQTTQKSEHKQKSRQEFVDLMSSFGGVKQELPEWLRQERTKSP